MCKPTPSSSKSSSTIRKACYATTSFCLGAWAFYKVNSISGPAFEPILAACQNPDISIDDFAKETGYHVYEPRVGLVLFNILVCLITQFLLELRETHPAGLLTWGGVIVVSLPLAVMSTVIAGRRGTRGPVNYPTIIGLLYQLFGISVMYPLVYNTSYIFSNSQFGVPVTNVRSVAGAIMTMPGVILTYLVFSQPTDSYIWTVSAGILGGPIMVMLSLLLLFDKSSSLEPTFENIKKSANLVQNALSAVAVMSFVFWLCLVAVAYDAYGFAFVALWSDIWTDAGPSVAFMTIDAGVLFLGMLLFIAYQSESKAFKTVMLTPIVGPGAACCMTFKELEHDAASALIAGAKKAV